MTIEEKRKALKDFCNEHGCCGDCPLLALPFGCAAYAHMSDYEIEEAYTTAFPDTEPTTNDVVNHPKHYCREGAMESIDEMVLLFGVEAVKHFCLLNAWKYRYRAADKNGAEDLKKSDWYIRKYRELCGEQP